MSDSGKKSLRRVQQKCSVHTCYYSVLRHEDGDKVSYFRLPKDEARAKLWLDAIGRKSNVPRVFVCEMHFTKNFISVVNLGTRVVSTAVPTLNLPKPGDPPFSDRAHGGLPAPTPHDNPACSTSDALAEQPTDLNQLDDADIKIDVFVKEEAVVTQKRNYEEEEPSTSSASDYPIKRERLDEYETSTGTPERQAELDKLIELSNAYLEKELAEYIEAKVHLQSHARGKQFDENWSLFALKLYHSYPQAYKLMQQSLGLPSTLQIRGLFRPLQGEMSPQWAKLLRLRFCGAAPAARACVVCVARAPLRAALAYAAPRDRLLGLAGGAGCGAGAGGPRAARQAAVLLARGLRAAWRQPLACRPLPAAHDPRELRLWITRVLTQLFDIGLDVHALVTDFDDGFVPTGPIVTPEKPYFMVGDRQVYSFYDSTQLMISFRDHFMKYNINLEDSTASWEDIEKLHEYNKKGQRSLPTGLTDEHVRPPAGGAPGPAGRRARLAAEALARPVADALGAAAGPGGLDGADGTARLVATIADLADLMRKDLGAGSEAYFADVKVLSDLIRRLKRMSLVDKGTGRAAADPGLLAALRAGARGAAALLEAARRAGAALPLRALNNDPLHEFFDRVRALHRVDAPTTEQMLAAFKQSFAFDAMKPFKSREDGQLEEFLKAARGIRDLPPAGRVAPAPATLLPREQWTALLRATRGRASPPALARELMARCLAVHGGCSLARAYCGGARPPEGLLRYLEAMARRFPARLAELAAPAGLLAALLDLMTDSPFEAPCACFPTLYLKTMFFRYKIYTLVRFNNKKLRRDPDAELSITSAYVVDLCDDDDDEK